MGAILSMPYMTLPAGVTTTGGSIWLGPDCITGWAMHVITTGTLTGAFRFYKSNDPRARPDHHDRANADWREFTADVAADIDDPAGGVVNFTVEVGSFYFDFLRMDYVHTGGTGTITARFSGRST